MLFDRIAVRLIDRPCHRPGDLPVSHPYRRRWWLPAIGPTATVLLDYLAPVDAEIGVWQIYSTVDLTTAIGIGKPHKLDSSLVRTFDRLVRYRFGTYDIEPGHDGVEPCISLYATVHLVPESRTCRWSGTLQENHAVDLANLHRSSA